MSARYTHTSDTLSPVTYSAIVEDMKELIKGPLEPKTKYAEVKVKIAKYNNKGTFHFKTPDEIMNPPIIKPPIILGNITIPPNVNGVAEAIKMSDDENDLILFALKQDTPNAGIVKELVDNYIDAFTFQPNKFINNSTRGTLPLEKLYKYLEAAIDKNMTFTVEHLLANSERFGYIENERDINTNRAYIILNNVIASGNFDIMRLIIAKLSDYQGSIVQKAATNSALLALKKAKESTDQHVKQQYDEIYRLIQNSFRISGSAILSTQAGTYMRRLSESSLGRVGSVMNNMFNRSKSDATIGSKGGSKKSHKRAKLYKKTKNHKYHKKSYKKISTKNSNKTRKQQRK